MKIAFFEVESWEESYLQKRLKRHTLKFFNCPLQDSDLTKLIDYDLITSFIYSEFTETRLKRLPKLKGIVTMSTGYDHINLRVCQNLGIKVCNVPYYGENTVAEHTFALILALSRKIIDTVQRARQNDFSLKGLRGFDLKGKTIGVIGPGHIGQHVIRMAKGFEMNVLAYAKHPDLKLARILRFKYTDLNTLLASSDIITIHCPSTSETKHLINKKNIKLIKKGAYLINTARGDIVDTKALLYGLQKKILAGAGLDVIEGEADIREEKQLLHKQFVENAEIQLLIENHVLLQKHNVIYTSHNAFNSKEALQRILDTTIENIQGISKGKPRNQVQ